MVKREGRTISIMKVSAVVFWLTVWHIVSKIINQEFLLASPYEVSRQIILYMLDGTAWNIIINSFFHISAGFIAAIFLGTLTAVLSYKFNLFRILIDPLMTAIKSVTTASVIILFLVWSKPEYLSIIVSVFMAFPIIYTSILKGLSEVDGALLEMAEVFRISPLKKIIYIYVSQIMPYFESACISSLGLAWKAGIAAEVIGLPAGTIGLNLYEAKIYLNTVNLFSWTVIIVMLSFLSEKIFTHAIRYCIRNIERGKLWI